ncbi:hypothetical protein ABZ769_33475 [Streptomyces olivoreticuli]
MMKADSTPVFAADWTALVIGLLYLLRSNLSLTRQISSMHGAQAASLKTAAPDGEINGPTLRWRSRFKSVEGDGE